MGIPYDLKDKTTPANNLTGFGQAAMPAGHILRLINEGGHYERIML